MARYDFRTQRLFVEADLVEGGVVEADRGQANYLLNVLRMRDADPVLLFNGRDGEWRARLRAAGRKRCSLAVESQTRRQTPAPTLRYCFAPLKQARLDYMVQKAVEMGAGHLEPVITQHTQVSRVNSERMRANAIEAAEQCGVLAIAQVHPPVELGAWIGSMSDDDVIVFCDEAADGVDSLTRLAPLKGRKLAVLIGPEGGFSAQERALLLDLPQTVAISLGPRILRADTAAVAALTLVQAVAGDWSDD